MTNEVQIFVSYSHKDIEDKKELVDDYLKNILEGEEKDVKFWIDENGIRAGEIWNEKIEANIWASDIALILISPNFLESHYCQKEVDYFINQKSHIIPIILSQCEWKSYRLSNHQCLPGGGETIKEHYTDPSRRGELFLKIFKELKNRVESVRKEITYKYDVFISYNYHETRLEWIKKHFIKNFEPALSDQLAPLPPPEIYFYVPGTYNASHDLYDKLGTSKVMISFWNPRYFCTDWCGELAHMLARQEEKNYYNPNNNKSLVFPIIINDGKKFTDYLCDQFTSFDFIKYIAIVEGTELYKDFKNSIEELALRVNDGIIGARSRPHLSWKDVNWNNKAKERFLPKINIESPIQTKNPG